MDHNIRNAIEAGAPVEAAYMMGSYNTARHFHIEHLVGSIAPGRYADVVLLDDPKTVSITRVIATGSSSPGAISISPKWCLLTIRTGSETQ